MMKKIFPEDAEVFYYGLVTGGTKYHNGYESEEFPSDDGTFRVKAMCGKWFFQEGKGQRPPAEFDETVMCKSCYRTFAWELMVATIKRKQAIEKEVISRIEFLTKNAQNESWSRTRLMSELLDLEQDLKSEYGGIQHSVPKTFTPQLTLLKRQAIS